MFYYNIFLSLKPTTSQKVQLWYRVFFWYQENISSNKVFIAKLFSFFSSRTINLLVIEFISRKFSNNILKAFYRNNLNDMSAIYRSVSENWIFLSNLAETLTYRQVAMLRRVLYWSVCLLLLAMSCWDLYRLVATLVHWSSNSSCERIHQLAYNI